ncbi:MAG: restriction endonuclease subunit S [Acinetobacter sp.]
MSENWITTNLGEYISFKNGKSSPSRDMGDDIPVYGSNGIIGFSSENNADENSLIVGRVGSYCGSVYHSKIKCWVTDNAIIGIPKLKGESEFWYFLLTKLQLNSYRSGSGQPLLNQSTLNSISISIPEHHSVRRMIGKQLFSFENKIHLNNQINQTLETIAQAIFKSWFIDFEPVRAKIAAKLEGADPEIAAMCVISGKSEAELEQMVEEDFAELRATAALFPDELVENELGEVPKGWEYKKLKDLCRVINGRAYKNTEFKEEGIPIVRIQNLTGGGKTVFSDLDLPQDKLIEKEDFIYAWSATFGPYIWRGPKSIYHYHIWKMDVDETIISRYFLYLTMFRKTESMKSAGTGSIFTHLTKVIMESQDVLIADNAINMLFKDRIDKIFKLISLKSDEIKNLENIRDTLLPKLLSGEVDVTTLADTKNSSDKEQIA